MAELSGFAGAGAGMGGGVTGAIEPGTDAAVGGGADLRPNHRNAPTAAARMATMIAIREPEPKMGRMYHRRAGVRDAHCAHPRKAAA
jgi:hypothetical protein